MSVIIGIGVDIVELPRFARSIQRTPGLLARLLHPSEQQRPAGGALSISSLAARFAAKEALAKALGAPAGLSWLDATVVEAASGRLSLKLVGSTAELAQQQGVDVWHLSVSHDGDSVIAFVVAEGRGL